MNEIILLFKKVSPLQRRYKQFSYGGGGDDESSNTV